MLHYVLQSRRHQHEDRVAVREGPDDPCPPPDLAVVALGPVVRPDPAPVLRREFRVGQRFGKTVAHRPRGRPAELWHAELDFLDARDEPSRVVAAVIGLPTRCSLVAICPDSLGHLLVKRALSVSSTVFLTRFYMPLGSDSSSTDTMFADTARAPFVNDLLFSRWKSYDEARAVFRYAVVNG